MSAPTVAPEQPVVTSAPHRFVLLRRASVPHSELGQTISATFGELYGWIGQSGTFPAGPQFVVYEETSDMGIRWDMAICAPIAGPVAAPPGFEFTEMPSGPVVTLTHVGSYESLGSAYDQLDAYLEANHIQKAGPPREFYLSPPEVPSDETRTLVEWPINPL